MRPILILLAACGFAACVTEPPERDLIHCLYPGDTIAYQVVTVGGIAILCDWTVQSGPSTCTIAPAQRYGQRDCVEGEKWPRA